MAILELVGAGLSSYSVYKYFQEKSRDKRELYAALHESFEEANLYKIKNGEKEFPKLLYVKKEKYGWELILQLPIGTTISKVKSNIKILEEATASSIKIKPIRGRVIQMNLGTMYLEERMDYDISLVQEGKLTIPYYTPFGLQYLDFTDESVCHLIVSGVTRMGKSVFLRLLFTQLVLATKGNIEFYYINNKIEDHYPMQHIPQIPEPAESVADATRMLHEARERILERKNVLRASKTVVNVKQWNEKYPDDPMHPIFIVFDEFGRFADDDNFQDLVVEISETAGYLDVHLVIATQRPDATTVLNPRIRANILTRVCFQTADESNSKIVVHTPDAFHLGEIRGRSIVLDGGHKVSQIPYVSEQQTMDLLEPYRRIDEYVNEERQDDTEVSETLPSFITGTLGEIDMSDCGTTSCNSKQDNEKIGEGWLRLADTETEG